MLSKLLTIKTKFSVIKISLKLPHACRAKGANDVTLNAIVHMHNFIHSEEFH